VEHDEETIRSADYIVDMGPGAGIHGGHVVAEGSPKQIQANKRSLTGKYLSGEYKIDVPTQRKQPIDYLTIKGAQENNLKNLTVQLPLGVLCGITGVSGSGKSTLMNITVMPALRQKFGERIDHVGKYSGLDIPRLIERYRHRPRPHRQNTRSNPATYTKLLMKSANYSPTPRKPCTRLQGRPILL
jgi:excinuclease ABC subunit A